MINSLILTNRVRIARNIFGMPFSWRMEDSLKEATADTLSVACKAAMPGLQSFSLSDLSDIQRGVFAERHSISSRMAHNNNPWQRLLLQKDESLAVSIHDTDHLRVQCMADDVSLPDLFTAADSFCHTLETDIPFARHSRYGCLTASPEDAGTGTRASVLIRLPALCLSRRVKHLADLLYENAITLKPAFPEKTTLKTGIYILYNSRTMGIPASQIVEDVASAANQAAHIEAADCERLLRQNRLGIMDSCLRSYGLLRYAMRLSLFEARKAISDIWFASDMGWLDLAPCTPRRLLAEIMPNYLAMVSQHEISENEERAIRVKSILEGENER